MQCLIVLGGERPSSTLLNEIASQSDYIIAADSGYNAFDDQAISPDLVIGDLDSIQGDSNSRPIKTIHAPEQTATDFEKALCYVPTKTNCITILGGTGLRSDHFLTNLLIVAGIKKEIETKLIDDLQVIHRIVPNHLFKIRLELKTTVSLIPFANSEGVSTNGLKWNLQNSNMGISKQLGQSNYVEKEEIEISIKAGILYLIVNG